MKGEGDSFIYVIAASLQAYSVLSVVTVKLSFCEWFRSAQVMINYKLLISPCVHDRLLHDLQVSHTRTNTRM